MNLGNVVDAITVFVIYFFCEWLPIFVIYLSHYSDFSSEAQAIETLRRGSVDISKQFGLIRSPGPKKTTAPTNQHESMLDQDLRRSSSSDVSGNNLNQSS